MAECSYGRVENGNIGGSGALTDLPEGTTCMLQFVRLDDGSDKSTRNGYHLLRTLFGKFWSTIRVVQCGSMRFMWVHLRWKC